MRHMIRGRQLSRDTEHRKSLRRSLVQSLLEHGNIRTTLPKAKEVRAFAEKIITLARANNLNARRRVIAMLHDRRLVDKDQEFTGQSVVQKLFDEIAPRFADRNGGYTRIIKLSGHRVGDGGPLVVLQLLTESIKPAGTPRRRAGHRRRRYERRHEFAARVLKRKGEPQTQTAEPQAQPGEPQPQAAEQQQAPAEAPKE